MVRLVLALKVVPLTLAFLAVAREDCKRGTWREAKDCCRNFAGFLPKLESYKNNKDIIDPMYKYNYTSVWLSYRRIIQRHWTWIDGSLAKHPPTDVNGKHCGFINLTTSTIQASECGSSRGYICEKTGCTSCNSLHWGAHVCVQSGVSCFVPVCDWNSWYNARASCADSDMDLAMFMSVESIKYLPTCDSYWIGIRKEIWSDTEEREINLGLWDKSQPKETGNCSIFSRARKDFHIEAYSCARLASILCLHTKLITAETWENITTLTRLIGNYNTTLGTSDALNMKWIGIWISIPGIVVLLLVVGYLFYRRKKRSGYSGVSVKEDNEEPKENQRNIRLLLAESQRKLFGNVDLWSWYDDHVRVQLDDVYVDLVLVKTSHTPQMATMKKLESYTQIFTEVHSYQKGNFFFLQGDAGMGKSTMAYKVILDWTDTLVNAAGKNIMNVDTLKKFRYVVLIVLRNIQSGQNLQTIIKEQLVITHTDAADLVKLFSNNQKSTLLILDGYDEYNEALSPELTEITHRKYLPYINILITSRHPYSFHFATTKFRPDLSLILRGFTIEGVLEYVNKFFHKNRVVGQSLFEEIEKQADYRELSRCPAFLLLMTILWRDEHILPSSITDFYEKFTRYLLVRYERKRLSLRDCTDPENVLVKYHDKLMKIAEVAQSGLTEESALVLNFTLDKVKNKVEEAWDYGIFKHDVRHKGENQKVYFLHKTFQEFFISYYIVHTSPSCQNELWLRLCNTQQALRDAYMIIKFVDGFGKDAFVKKLETLSSYDSVEVAALQTSLQMSCMSENMDISLTLPRMVNLQISDVHSLNMYIKYLSMDGEQLEELILHICELKHARLLQHVNASKLSKIRMFLSPVSISLEKSYISEELESIISKTKLEELEIGGFDMTLDESCQTELFTIFKIIRQSRSLHTVIFTLVTLSDLHVKELSKAISESNIKTFVLRKCEQFTTNNFVDIMSVLPNCPSLTHFDASGNSFGDDIKCILDHADKLENLEELNLTLNQVTKAIRDFISTELKKILPTLLVVFDDDLNSDI